MDFVEKARIRMEHWITHNDQHQEEYETFVKELEEGGKESSAKHVKEMIELSAKCTECLRNALEKL